MILEQLYSTRQATPKALNEDNLEIGPEAS